MTRKEIIAFCNEKIFPLLPNRLDVDCKETVRLVHKWRIGKPMAVEMRPSVVNGFLFINDEPAGRIAPILHAYKWSEEVEYWEGRILERQMRYDL